MPQYNWRIQPSYFQTLLGDLKYAIANNLNNWPTTSLNRRICLLDNWNEWGEGHYISPAQVEGFGYLEAVRRTFGNNTSAHVDVIPQDVGRGLYDWPNKEWLKWEETRWGIRRDWLQDTFGTTTTYDINYDISNPDRQSGSVTPVSYVESAWSSSGGIYDAVTSLNEFNYVRSIPHILFRSANWWPAVTVGLDHNFVEYKKFRLTVKAAPDVWNFAGPSLDVWTGVAFGTTVPYGYTVNGAYVPTNGMCVIVRKNDVCAVYDNGTLIASSARAPMGDSSYDITIDCDMPDYIGTAGKVNVSINSVPLLTNYSRGINTYNYVSLIGYGPRAGDFALNCIDGVELTNDEQTK